MRVIIAGSRDIRDSELVEQAVCEAQARLNITVDHVLSGGAEGVDRIAEKLAAERGIPVKRFVPDYDHFPPNLRRRAPLERNSLMVENAEALVAIWDGKSRGTADVIRKARKAGLKVYVKTVAQGGQD